MEAEFIGKSKHYKTGKVYKIKSKFCTVLGDDNIKNIIAVYNINDKNAKYKFKNSDIASIGNNNNASSNMPYRTYTTIEDFLTDWKVIKV